MAIALAICIAALIASLAVLLKNPSKITEIAGGLVWAITFTAALSYGLYLQLSQKTWQTTIYEKDLTSEITQELKKTLDEIQAKYRVTQSPFKTEIKFTVLSPFKATITIRKWRHVGYKVRGVAVPTGTVIEVFPRPRRAPNTFKKIMWRLFFNTGLIEQAYDWR
ncbi:MAG: hypothetical protein DRN04_00540 [Thermoprotei archaeon]|nr:MAG: hypothetical protein DRN04_00540 [Thermoprotei archaeon]